MERFEDTSFGEVLQRFRKRARLTQTALAERIGAHRSTVSFWERGEYLPETLTTVLELARALHLDEAEKRLLVEARFGTVSILPWQNLPEPNPYFTGREALLQTLHATLTVGKHVILTQPQAISGLGGIGKTQLALAYAYRYRESYHDILWALADSRETLVASSMTIAEQLRLLPGAEQDQRNVVEAVKRWLREHKGWLLILDNVEDLQLVRDFVPTPRQGAVVLTTRRIEASPVARTLTLDVLPEEDGVLLLLRRAGYLEPEATLAAALPQHQETARTIVQILGGLPLALDQAGAYVAETRCRLSDYLALLRREQVALLKRRGSVPGEHPKSVTTTFALAFERVQHQSEAASDLLRLCAYLAPEAIPLDLLSQEGADLGPVLASVASQPFALDAALETLQAYSLVQLEGESRTLSLHRLVQAVQQAALPEPEQRCWAERTVRLLGAAFPTASPVTWERCQQLVPHALMGLAHIERWGFAFLEAASLLRQAGRYLFQRGTYEPAVLLLQRALSLYEQVLGSDHLEVAESLHALGELFLVQLQFERALPLLQRALSMRERTLGSTHPNVADILNTLANLSRVRGQYEQAVHYYQRALAIVEHAFGPTHPDVAWNLHCLATVYRTQGHETEALPLYQRALAIYEQAPGPPHPNMAWSLLGRAELYRTQKQYEHALPLVQRALALQVQTLGPRHHNVARISRALATLYREHGEPQQALSLIQQALAIQEQVLGREHLDVAESLNILAHLYQDQGQQAQALPLYQRALTIFKQTLPDHPNTLAMQESLAGLVLQTERTQATGE